MTSGADRSHEAHIRLNASLSELERLTEWLDAFCEAQGVPDDPHYQLNIAVEEVVINAIRHGGCAPGPDAIEVSIRLDHGVVETVIVDSGQAFNPLDVPPPDLAPDMAARKIGGLGIHLVRSLMNSVEYERAEGRNRLVLRKSIEGGEVS